MKNVLLAVFLTPLFSLFVVYTKANLYSFWLGILLCLMAELVIFLAYFFSKVHYTQRDAISLKLASMMLINRPAFELRKRVPHAQPLPRQGHLSQQVHRRSQAYQQKIISAVATAANRNRRAGLRQGTAQGTHREVFGAD
jgi:hypothetical protein